MSKEIKNKLGITEGEWFISGTNEIVSMPSQCKITNRISGWNYEQAKSNALLTVDAANTYQKCWMSPSEMNEKMLEMAKLLLEARDALPAITLVKAKLHNVSLSLAERIENSLEPWRDDENGI